MLVLFISKDFMRCAHLIMATKVTISLTKPNYFHPGCLKEFTELDIFIQNM